eukprot:TRINITY_DN82154_c0_g1_i1.p1 TRINITY_DN82154_c0_g1~~TRINITY_DN82154_c0_g1_i1.p1  ORF type:complete len:111 (-),score=2.34 TRINITY_DN82154_c0_g1_i1:94-426(-)
MRSRSSISKAAGPSTDFVATLALLLANGSTWLPSGYKWIVSALEKHEQCPLVFKHVEGQEVLGVKGCRRTNGGGQVRAHSRHCLGNSTGGFATHSKLWSSRLVTLTPCAA